MSTRRKQPVSSAAASGGNAVDKLKQVDSDSSHVTGRLLHWNEIPTWQHDNEFILSAYRHTSGSIWTSFESLLYLNNQTINSYSHYLGAIVFALLPLYFHYAIQPTSPYARTDDLIVVAIYCYGVSICFTLSATFHVLCNHSCSVALYWNKLDYLGILVLMWGAGIPTIYYGFLCNPYLQRIYWSMTTGTALCCTYMTLHPHFASPAFRHWRACFYAGFGFSSIIFVIHGLLLFGWQVQKARMSLVYMGWMATANITGALIYAARIPERWVPYRFDIWGASHQTFHVAVMVAAWIHFRGLVQAFQIVRSMPETC
ncbi:mPR-like GPCR protein [Dissoconium aciculare CBS 342.82]|uniref:MPR-like GPCR protein n=1 Tax=Dissoconium aciculare CBS 342.82 TaxID=1314786 RepID=A0A6J3MCL7_9PEZI|nr:mPR-like GPCR protein [Dissoconium aciculare CBS 342.82]KAF1825765.1 mPR-like GPCR protein [Dissoconium aciculare CBS 342.82]